MVGFEMFNVSIGELYHPIDFKNQKLLFDPRVSIMFALRML